MDGANGQTGGKNCSSTFVQTAFISFGLFNIFPALLYRLHSFPLACLIFFRNLTPSDSQSCVRNDHTIHKLSYIIDCSPNNGIDTSFTLSGGRNSSTKIGRV